MKPLVEEVEALVARAGTHPIWGYAHCLRVHSLAEGLAASEGLSYDEEILRLAALLHDVGLYKAYALRGGRSNHARRSAAVAERILGDADFPPHATRAVVEAIEQHPPGAPGAPRGSGVASAESTLLKDAVALDYLGAVGLSRVLAMVGAEEDVPDLPAAVRHAQELHATVPDLLTLESSKTLARQRVAQTNEFLSNLKEATDGLKLL